MNIQLTHFPLCEFILEENGSHNENKSSISLLKIFLQLSYPTLDAQRSWERIPIFIFAHEQASGVVRLLSISLLKRWDHCSGKHLQAAHAPRRVLLPQDPGSWALAQVGCTSSLEGDEGKCWRGWGMQTDCFLCTSVEAGKLVGVGGYGQSSGDPRRVYMRGSGVCAAGPRAARVVRGSLQAMWVSVK